jgi:hypothetical protein
MEIVTALAWPVVVAFALWLLKTPLGGVIDAAASWLRKRET